MPVDFSMRFEDALGVGVFGTLESLTKKKYEKNNNWRKHSKITEATLD